MWGGGGCILTVKLPIVRNNHNNLSNKTARVWLCIYHQMILKKTTSMIPVGPNVDGHAFKIML